MKSFSNIDNFNKRHREPSKFFYGLIFGFGGGFIVGMLWVVSLIWS